MKKIVISVLVMLNITFAGTDSDIDNFSRLSKSKQDEIIQKDFKILDELVSEMTGIIANIDEVRAKIANLKARNKNIGCDTVELLNGDITEFKRQLSTIQNKNSVEYKKLNEKYIRSKELYNLMSCEKKGNR